MSTALPLTRLETFWASLVLPSFAGTGHGFTVAEKEVDYLDGLGRFMEKASDKACLGIRVAFLLAVTAPIWITGRFTGFASLTPAERSDVLDKMSRHSVFFVRELCLLLKLIACMAIFRQKSTRERSGYDGETRAVRAHKRSLNVLRAEPPISGDYATEAAQAAALDAAGGAR